MTATGCGLVLDTKPRDNSVDSGTGEQDGGQQDGEVPGCVIDDECQNGNVCDGRETCVDGQCVGTDAIMNCADEFACTDDACDPQLGCVFTPVDDRCTNGGICFADMGCSATRPCQEPGDCGVQNACFGLFECVQNVCRRAPALSCPDNGCLIGGCFNGGCVYVPDSGRCPDSGACLESTCQVDGECSVPVPNDDRCDDGIDCTVDQCLTLSLSSFCSHTPDHTLCDDGVACTDNFCAPGDPTDLLGDGCAMRLNDSICADAGGFTGCVSPVCLPTGCDDGVTVLPCAEGGICNLDSGECEFPDTCDACADLSNPCAPTTCEPNQQLCLASLVDPCATTLPGVIGFCDTSSGNPECAFRPNPQTLPPVEVVLPVLP